MNRTAPVTVASGNSANTRSGHLTIIGIAGLQLDLEAGNNLGRIGQEVAAVKRRLPWVDLVLLTELCAHGADVRSAEPAGGSAERELSRIARESGVWLVAGSLYQRQGDEVFNVAPVIDPSGRVIARYRKMFPFRPYEVGVAAGEEFCVFTLPGLGRFGVSICYDVWFPEVSRTLAWLGAEVILSPSLTNTIDRDTEIALTRANAAANQCYVLNVNGAGGLGCGQSVVCGPGGEVIHRAGVGREVFAVEVDLGYLRRVRRRGWHGLGQPLKSFRDCPVAFPAYQPGARSPALDELGPLTTPKSALRIE